MAALDAADQHSLTPLALDSKIQASKLSPLALAAFLCVAGIVGLLGWLTLAGDPNGGEPQVIIALTLSGSGTSEENLLQPAAPPDRITIEQDGTISAQSGPEQASPWNDPNDLNTFRDQANNAAPRSMSTAFNAKPLRPAPDPTLIAQGEFGSLPVIAADGRKASEVYARPFPANDPRPRIALLVRGLGLSKNTTQKAIDNLPPEITLSFVPYPEGLQSWVNKARARGHEIMLEVPMEPFDYPKNDPGPFTLLTTLSTQENISRLEWLLSRFSGYVGVTNYLGDNFTTTDRAISPILREVSERGLLYLADGAAQLALVENKATSFGLGWAASDKSLDYGSASTIEEELLKLEAQARRNGYAVGTGFAFPVAIEQISSWATTLEAKGIVLAPISAVAYTQEPE